MTRRLLSAALVLCLLFSVQAAAADTERSSRVLFHFDTVITLVVYSADQTLLDDLSAACDRYERLLSKTVQGSDVDRINSAGGQPVTVDPETWEILRCAKEYSAMTGGAFSVTIAPVSALWDFTGGTKRMPTSEELEKALPLVGDSQIELLDGNRVRLPEGCQVDLGGIAKGYIADQLAGLSRSRCFGAVLNFGGNVYTVGQKPNGTPFGIAITDPENPSGSVGTIYIGDATVVTSGTYERFFVTDGVTYHHILDPETGYPAVTDLTSATIVCSSSMQADALATACIVLGREAAMKLLEENQLDGILIDRENHLSWTEGFAEKYSLVAR